MDKKRKRRRKKAVKAPKTASVAAAVPVASKAKRNRRSSAKKPTNKSRKRSQNTKKTAVSSAKAPDVNESDEYSSDTDGENCLSHAGDPALPSEIETAAAASTNTPEEDVDAVQPGDEFSDSSDEEAEEPLVVEGIFKRRDDGKKVVKVRGLKPAFEYEYVKKKCIKHKYESQGIVTKTLLQAMEKDKLKALCLKRGKSGNGARTVLLKRALKLFGWGPKGKHFADWRLGKVFDNNKFPLTIQPGFIAGPWARLQRKRKFKCPSPLTCFHIFFTDGKCEFACLPLFTFCLLTNSPSSPSQRWLICMGIKATTTRSGFTRNNHVPPT